MYQFSVETAVQFFYRIGLNGSYFEILVPKAMYPRKVSRVLIVVQIKFTPAQPNNVEAPLTTPVVRGTGYGDTYLLVCLRWQKVVVARQVGERAEEC
eukprot:scaffold119560_cov30-Attheya_sp.AAC.1